MEAQFQLGALRDRGEDRSVKVIRVDEVPCRTRNNERIFRPAALKPGQKLDHGVNGGDAASLVVFGGADFPEPLVNTVIRSDFRDGFRIDETMELFDVVAVSAGARGTQILLDPKDYVRAVGGTLGPIALVAPVGEG